MNSGDRWGPIWHTSDTELAQADGSWITEGAEARQAGGKTAPQCVCVCVCGSVWAWAVHSSQWCKLALSWCSAKLIRVDKSHESFEEVGTSTESPISVPNCSAHGKNNQLVSTFGATSQTLHFCWCPHLRRVQGARAESGLDLNG